MSLFTPIPRHWGILPRGNPSISFRDEFTNRRDFSFIISPPLLPTYHSKDKILYKLI